MEKILFTSESVSAGHPDKMADQISDAILDEILKQDPNSRVAVETYLKTGLVVVGGEVKTNAVFDVEEIVRETIKNIGYDSSDKGFDYKTCAVLNNIGKQSNDINQGVDRDSKEEQGAGDQGIMFGYATNETDDYLPATLIYSHALLKRHEFLRKGKLSNILRPDAKSQVTFEYDKNGIIKQVDTVVLSTQHCEDIDIEELRKIVLDEIILSVIPNKYIAETTKFLINPTGRFVIGGPMGDAGLTGRKIIVDTYGGAARHGGGAFSGKDPSKVDRSAAYAARHVAKNIVAAGLAERFEVQLSYAIGVADPVSISVEDFGTGKISKEEIIKIIRKVFNLTPAGIEKELNLLRPIYFDTATFGHFTNRDYSWEQLNKIEEIKKCI